MDIEEKRKLARELFTQVLHHYIAYMDNIDNLSEKELDAFIEGAKWGISEIEKKAKVIKWKKIRKKK
jgi:hypothetical protein